MSACPPVLDRRRLLQVHFSIKVITGAFRSALKNPHEDRELLTQTITKAVEALDTYMGGCATIPAGTDVHAAIQEVSQCARRLKDNAAGAAAEPIEALAEAGERLRQAVHAMPVGRADSWQVVLDLVESLPDEERTRFWNYQFFNERGLVRSIIGDLLPRFDHEVLRGLLRNAERDGRKSRDVKPRIDPRNEHVHRLITEERHVRSNGKPDWAMIVAQLSRILPGQINAGTRIENRRLRERLQKGYRRWLEKRTQGG